MLHSSLKASMASASVIGQYSARPIVSQPGVLWADARVVETCRDRVGGRGLPVLVLEE